MNYWITGLLGIFVIMAQANTISAQTSAPDDALAQSMITKCLEDEKSNQHNGSACINQFTDKCLDNENNFTTKAMRQCINIEFKVWDKLLNDNYRELMASLENKKQKTALRQAQRNWNKFVTSFCPLAHQFNGGTMFLLTGDQCAMEMTAAQSIELRKLIGEPL